MNEQDILEKIKNTSPEQLSSVVCKALYDSDIEYEYGISHIQFDKLIID